MKPSFACSACGFRFRADARYVGRSVRCPNSACGRPVLLRPAVEQAVAAIRAPAAVGASAAPPVAVRRSAVAAQGRVLSGRSRWWLSVLTVAAICSLSLVVFQGSQLWLSAGSLQAATSETATGNSSPAAPQSPPLTPEQQEQQRLAEAQAALEKTRSDRLEQQVLPYLKQYCFECHGEDSQEAGIVVHDLRGPDDFLADFRRWERVYRMINSGVMPPADHTALPAPEQQQSVARILHAELYEFDCRIVRSPGRSTLRRLNRAEYNNTIRDLFGLQITPADKFPQDDVGEGFDNIGDVLNVPPLLMEKYLDAAEEVAGAVVDLRDFSKGIVQTFAADALTNGGEKPTVDDRGYAWLSTNGRLLAKVTVPADGRYVVQVDLTATQAGDDFARAALVVDGQAVHEAEVPGLRREQQFEQTVELKAGEHEIAGEFLNDFYDPEAPERRRDRNLGIRKIIITGPEGGGVDLWHETHRRFVTSRPGEGRSVQQAADGVLRPIMRRAFRRPVTDEEVQRYVTLVERTMAEQSETYDYGVYVALQAVLVSPDFLFRVEADPPADAADRALNSFEVASRLSYFLWSSMPDEELLQLAETGRLLDGDVLRQQARRMLRDPKSEALSRNFAAQWLNLRNLADVRPNPEVYPDFDDALRKSMARETELLFASIVQEDRSIEEFLSADYSFVNERLARHYGLTGVQGEDFVRVSLAGTQRTGVLTHASILTLTSNPGRTSPVKRGKWILENILAEVPPPAPAGVPALEEAGSAAEGMSLREKMELHRRDAACAVCHRILDPLGLGFENFDGVGRWRDEDAGKVVDASGELPGGDRFAGPGELLGILRGRKDRFFQAFTEKMLVYSLGRGLEYYDRCTVEEALRQLKSGGNRFSVVVEAIVTSDAFLRRAGRRELSSGSGSGG